MRTRLLLLALLAVAVPVQGQTLGAPPVIVAQPGPTLTIAWDASISPTVVGYLLERADVSATSPTGCGPWTTTVDVGPVTTYTPASDSPLALVPSCFAVRAYDANKVQSSDSNIIIRPAPPPDPTCAPIIGTNTVSVFVTSWQATTGQPGSLASINADFASPNSPVTTVNVRLNGAIVRSMTGTTDLTGITGVRFHEPTVPGTYVLTLEAINLHGCSTSQTRDATGASMTVVVK